MSGSTTQEDAHRDRLNQRANQLAQKYMRVSHGYSLEEVINALSIQFVNTVEGTMLYQVPPEQRSKEKDDKTRVHWWNEFYHMTINFWAYVQENPVVLTKTKNPKA